MKKTILILVMILTANLLNAQITITGDELASQLRVGVSSVEYVDTTDRMLDIGTAHSINNYWDFSQAGFIPTVTYMEIVHYAFDSPYYSDFPQSSRAIVVGAIENHEGNILWMHVGMENDALVYYGFGMTTETRTGDVTFISQNLPAEDEAMYPMTYGSYWTYSFVQHDIARTVFGEFAEDVDVDVTCTVDAAGTLVLPNGDEVQALRIREVRNYVFDELDGEDEITEVVYTFCTDDGREVSLSVYDGQPSSGVVLADAALWCNDGVVDVEDDIVDNEIPSQFGLKQNYPNPFNPTTTIEYSITENSNVKIKVYDILGNEVATLQDGFLNAGNYKATFNADNLPSGNYFVRIQAGNRSDIKKMTLLK